MTSDDPTKPLRIIFFGGWVRFSNSSFIDELFEKLGRGSNVVFSFDIVDGEGDTPPNYSQQMSGLSIDQS